MKPVDCRQYPKNTALSEVGDVISFLRYCFSIKSSAWQPKTCILLTFGLLPNMASYGVMPPGKRPCESLFIVYAAVHTAWAQNSTGRLD